MGFRVVGLMSDAWFASTRLADNTYLIGEPPHVNSFLLVGDRRAVLFDSGMGISNIRTVVEELTDRDLLVVNSHYHFDHVGGNRLFQHVAIHSEGVGPLKAGPDPDWLKRYFDYSLSMLKKFRVYKEIDDQFFRLLTPEQSPRPLPTDFRLEEWQSEAVSPTQILEDGDVLQLGGRSLQVIHTPGHTPDCICLLDEASGALFAGDTISTGPIYAHLPDSDVDRFRRSVHGLYEEYRASIKVVYPAHMLRYVAPPSIVADVATGFDAVVSGQVTGESAEDVFGDAVIEYPFGSFSIVVPPPDQGAS